MKETGLFSEVREPTPYISIRLTEPHNGFDNSGNSKPIDVNGKGKLMSIAKTIINYLEPDMFVLGSEKLNKAGNPTHFHEHIHLYKDGGFKNSRGDELKKDTLQTNIRKLYKDMFGLEKCGNKQYSVQYVDVKTFNDWLIYPLKQVENFDLEKAIHKGYIKVNNEVRKTLVEVQRASYLKWVDCVEIFRKVEKKNQMKDSVVEKMFFYMREKDVKTFYDFVYNYTNFYIENCMVIPMNSINDKWLTYRLRYNIMTHADFAEAWVKKHKDII